MGPTSKDEPNIKELCHLLFEGLGSLADEVVMAHLRARHGDALGVPFDRYDSFWLWRSMSLGKPFTPSVEGKK